jgi:hypothetical protein
LWLTIQLAEREPQLVVVDDVRWADEASLRFLLFRSGGSRRLRLVCRWPPTPGEPAGEHVLTQLTAESLARVYPLAPLGKAAIGGLVRR